MQTSQGLWWARTRSSPEGGPRPQAAIGPVEAVTHEVESEFAVESEFEIEIEIEIEIEAALDNRKLKVNCEKVGACVREG